MACSRSEIMRAVGRRNTKPEVTVAGALKTILVPGLIERHRKGLPGSPDFVISEINLCLFVHGCFWHRHQGCRKATTPKLNSTYWSNKFADNVTRDIRVKCSLEEIGWRVATIWECETQSDEKLTAHIREILRGFQ